MASWEFTTMESTRNYEQIQSIENILNEVVTIQCIKYILIHFQQQAKLIFGEVREDDLIRNSEKGLISEEKLEMLENRYSNFNEKEVLTKKDTEKLIEDLSSNSKEKVVNEVEEVKEKDKEIDM